LKQIRLWHPDVNHAPEAPGRARAINWAYQVLSDSARRAEYDRALAAPRAEANYSYSTQPHPTDTGFEDADLQIRTWPAKFAIWSNRLGPFSVPFYVVAAVLEYLLEWLDLLLIGVRLFAALRPWPKAAYWIVWEFAALASFGSCVTSMFTQQQIANQIASITVWLFVFMPILYFPTRWVARHVFPSRPGSLAEPNR
jgi:hypothetical protein